MFELVLADRVARLALARPEARNAVPADGWVRLADAAEEAAAAGARLLFLSGRGGAFCAGADLGGFAAFRDDPAARAAFRTAMRDAFGRIANLPIPVVALIEGPCFGAGVALAMACDLRIAAPSARFAITPAKFGISYPQEDIARLVALVGPGQASRLLLSAAPIDAAEAVRIGLVEQIAEAGVDTAAAALAETMLANSADSLAALKRGVGLAAAGVASDAEQDRGFEAMLGADALAERLARLRERK